MSGQDQVFIKCAWRLIPLIMLLYFANITDRVNVGFAALTMNKDLGFSASVYGFGAGAFFLGYALFQIPANAILERVGARRWIFSILLVWGALSAANSLVTNAPQFYAVRIALGLVEAGFFPGMILYLTYWFTKAYRARLIALFMAALPLANIIGAPLSSAILGLNGLLGLAGWQWLFLIEGAPTMLLAFLVLRFLPDKPHAAPWLNDEEKMIIATSLASDDTSEQKHFWPALRDPRVHALGVVYFGYSISFYGVGLWLPQIVQGMGVSNLATGFVIAPAYLVALIAMIAWGRSSDARGERVWHVALPALMMMVSLLVASQSHSNPIIFIALSLVVVGSMALQGPFWVLPSAFLSGSAAAGGIALINTMGTAAGGFAGPYVLGLLREATGGYSAGMMALALGPLLTAGIVLLLARRLSPARSISSSV